MQSLQGDGFVGTTFILSAAKQPKLVATIYHANLAFDHSILLL